MGCCHFVQPDNAIAWLGIQGDVFDADKDMLMAAIGAITAMLIVSLNSLKYNKKIQ